MMRTKIGAGVLISAAMVLLAACGSGGSAGSGEPNVPTIDGSGSATQQPETTTAPETSTPTSTAVAGQPATSTGKGGVTTSAECKVADLKLSLRNGDSAAGTTYRSLVFTNKGSRTCTIQGFPGVSYVAGNDGHQVGPAAYRTGKKGSVVTLKPGASASSDIGFVQVANYDPGVCKPTAVRGLRVYPPHEYDSMFIAQTGTGCAGTPPGNQLTVATVKAGAGGA